MDMETHRVFVSVLFENQLSAYVKKGMKLWASYHIEDSFVPRLKIIERRWVFVPSLFENQLSAYIKRHATMGIIPHRGVVCTLFKNH